MVKTKPVLRASVAPLRIIAVPAQWPPALELVVNDCTTQLSLVAGWDVAGGRSILPGVCVVVGDVAGGGGDDVGAGAVGAGIVVAELVDVDLVVVEVVSVDAGVEDCVVLVRAVAPEVAWRVVDVSWVVG